VTEAAIRLARPSDAAAIAAIYAPFCTDTVVSFEYDAPSATEMAERVRKITARFPWLVLETAGDVAGYAYAGLHSERTAYRWSADVTVYVAAGRRRAGVGRALYTALFRILVLQGYYKAFAGVTLPNPGSVGLHTALGFQPVGVYRGVGYKLGAWHDVAWYQLALQPERPDPAPPRDLPAVLGSPEWDEALAAGAALYTLSAGKARWQPE
jgi:L-amino acid N-acyltransferase YncA